MQVSVQNKFIADVYKDPQNPRNLHLSKINTHAVQS